MAYPEALPNHPNEDNVESFKRSVQTAISDDHFFEEGDQILTDDLNFHWDLVLLPVDNL